MTRVPVIRALVALTVAGALVSGCGKSQTAPGGAQGAAGGKVLEGTISDAMINLDGSQAQAPLAPRMPEAQDSESAEEKQVVREVVQQADTPQAAASSTGDSDQPSGD